MMLLPKVCWQVAVVGFVGVTTINMAAGQASPLSEETKIGGFSLGCQAYTFNRFSVMEAIEKTA